MAASRARKYSLDLSKYYRKPATQVSLSIVLSLFIIAFFILIAIRPTLVTITKLQQEIEESERTLGKLETKVQSLERAAQVWETIKGRVEEVDQAIPQNGPHYQEIALTTEVVANEAGVTLHSLTLGESLLMSQVVDVYTGKKQEVIEMQFTTRVSGSFPQILTYMNNLLDLERIVGVDSVTVSKENVVDEGAQVGMSLSGTVQYLASSNDLKKLIELTKEK